MPPWWALVSWVAGVSHDLVLRYGARHRRTVTDADVVTPLSGIAVTNAQVGSI